jgi:hypothetical protein
VVEIYAAILGASIGVAGLSLSGFNKRQNEAHDAVVRLSVAVENIAGKLDDLHEDMKKDLDSMNMEFIHHPAFWVVIAAASELIALSPLKDNSVVQLVFTALRSIKPSKKG